MSNKPDTPHRLLKPEEIVVLSREIQAMIAAGVPLDMGMKQAAAGFDADLEQVARRIAERLEQGATIVEACQVESSIPAAFRAILVAGLSCGQSEAVLEDVSRLTEMQTRLRQSIKIGLVYPLTVIFLSLGLLGLIIVTMMPRIAGLYEQLHIEFPRWLAITQSIQLRPYHFLLWAVAFAGAFVWLIFVGRRSPLKGLGWIPGVSRVSSDFMMAHFAHVLSLLVKYQVPFPDALKLSADSIPSGRFQSQAIELAQRVSAGEEIEQALHQGTAFPPFLKWLLLIGHRDAELANTLSQASSFFHERARTRAVWISQVVPTVAVVCVGGTVTLFYTLTVFGPLVDLWTKLSYY